MSLFEQIAKTADPNLETGLKIALKKSMDNFDTLHAELMEAIEIIKSSRAYVQGAYECAFPDERENEYNLERIDNFLKKHS